MYVKECQFCLAQTCESAFVSNVFAENIGFKQGGVINYVKNRPVTTDNIFESSNYAPYGSDIAGYPFGVILINYDKYSLASGQPYQGQIVAAIVDADGNIILNDDSSYDQSVTNVFRIIRISADDHNSQVVGEYQTRVQNGIAVFKDLIFIGVPGSQNIPFLLSSPTITRTTEQEIIRFKSTQSQAQIFFDFRYCQTGEINILGECVSCNQGQFSLDPSESECNNCLSNAECLGGSKISVNPGFWRSSSQSTNILKCLNEEACIGGELNSIHDMNDSNQSFPLCSYGYGGKLCNQCVYVDGIQFTKGSDNSCNACPSKVRNIIAVVGTFLAMNLGFCFLLWINIRSEKESQISVALRILMNYVQIFITAASYQLNWPQYLSGFFSLFQNVGKVSEEFLSIECFLNDTGILGQRKPIFYYQTIGISLLPLLIVLVYSFFLYIGYKLCKNSRSQFRRQISITFILSLFSLHPTITRMLSSLFFCMEIDDGIQWLQQDLDIQCWTFEHLSWSFGIGLPSIIVWVIGVPLFGFVLLFRNRSNLHESEFFGKYKYMFQGLKSERFYWEFVNILRKVLLIWVNVFLNLYKPIFKALMSLIILFCFMQLQTLMQPYKSNLFNQLEHREVLAQISIFFGALFFLSIEISSNFQIVVFIAIIVFNYFFLATLFYCISLQFKIKRVDLIQRFLSQIAFVDVNNDSLMRSKTLIHKDIKMDSFYEDENISQILKSDRICTQASKQMADQVRKEKSSFNSQAKNSLCQVCLSTQRRRNDSSQVKSIQENSSRFRPRNLTNQKEQNKIGKYKNFYPTQLSSILQRDKDVKNQDKDFEFQSPVLNLRIQDLRLSEAQNFRSEYRINKLEDSLSQRAKAKIHHLSNISDINKTNCNGHIPQSEDINLLKMKGQQDAAVPFASILSFEANLSGQVKQFNQQ